MKLYSVFVLGLLWLGLFSQPEKEILEKVISAPKRVEFHGIWLKAFRYHGEWIETQQEIWHQRPDRTKILFLEPEKARGTVLLKEGGRVVFRRQGNRKGARYIRHYTGGFFGEEVNARRLDLLLENYRVKLGEPVELLDRRATEVRIEPRYEQRSRLNLWVDDDTGLVLKMEKYDLDGALSSRAEFKDLFFRLPAEVDLSAPADTAESKADVRQVAVYPNIETFRSKSDFVFYIPEWLPKGFMLDRIRSIRKKDREIYHFLYTDGLSWVSLFERVATEPEKPEAAAAADSVQRRGTVLVLHGQVENVRYALVGEVTVEELKAIRASLRPVTPTVGEKVSTGRIILIWLPVVIVLAIFLILRSKREAKHVQVE
jgi:outer membrane lipoprotein-sorting protein